MSEHPLIKATRKYCRENNLRYYIKNDALFIYDPTFKHYMQRCFNILNFNTEESIKNFIEEEVKRYAIEQSIQKGTD